MQVIGIIIMIAMFSMLVLCDSKLRQVDNTIIGECRNKGGVMVRALEHGFICVNRSALIEIEQRNDSTN